MANYKAQATEIINKMEMYARTHGFMVEHFEILDNPSSSYAYNRLEGMVHRDLKVSLTEARHVLHVYHYFRRLSGYDWEYDYCFNEMVDAYNSLVAYRFPKPTPQAEIMAVLQARLDNMYRPQRRVEDLVRVLRRHRPWFDREYYRNEELHPAVFKAWGMAEPADWHRLVLEWPHESKQGAHMVAYTRDEKYGEADRQLALSVTKYLTRHFPTLNANVIRDISAMYTEAEFGIVRTMDEMLEIIKDGPPSCMSGDDDEFGSAGDHHPYEVYDPELGWHMAYVKEGGSYTGRALLNDKDFVRTYRRKTREARHSDTDERLNSWLQAQGYSKASSWVGYSFKRINVRNNCGFLAPYLDGSDKDVEVCNTVLNIVDNGDGDYNCNETGGDADEREACSCACCGYRCSSDNMHSVGYHGDEQVCESCYENEYTVAYGRNGDEYAVPSDDVVEVDGEWYHANYLSDNDIVELHDGSYCKSDDAVYIESQSDYYPADSDLVCYTQAGEHELTADCVQLENGEWCLSDDAWSCDHSGYYYAHDDVTAVETACGKNVHPDHAEHYVLETTE